MTSLLGAIADTFRPRNDAPVPYTTDSRGGSLLSKLTGGGADRTRMMNAIGSVSTLFSVVGLTSNAVAQVEWHLYRKSPTGRDADRVEVTDHQALRLWNQANDFIPGPELRETVQQHLDTVGEGWIVVERAMGIPLGLWPVRPDRIEPVTDPKKYVTGYVYTGPDGEKVPLELDEVLRLKYPHPTDPHRGLGPVQSLLTQLDSIKYSEEWNRNFFLNSAEPGGIIEVPEGLEDHEFRQLSRRWNEQHRGVNRAHRVAILEFGTWKDRQFSMKDMQFAELRAVGRDTVLEAYRVHKNMLGISEDVNRANAEAGSAVFARWTTLPRLVRWKAMANGPYLKLFGASGQGLEFDFENPVPEDQELENAERTSKAQAAATLTQAGYAPEDVLGVVGLPAMRFVGAQPAPTVGGTGA